MKGELSASGVDLPSSLAPNERRQAAIEEPLLEGEDALM